MQLYVGSYWNFAFQLYDQTNNVPVDITGMTFECDIMSGNRRCPNILLTIGSGITILNPVDGAIMIELTSDQTNQIGPGAIIGSIWRTDGNRQILGTFDGVLDLPASNLAQYGYWSGYSPDYSTGAWP